MDRHFENSRSLRSSPIPAELAKDKHCGGIAPQRAPEYPPLHFGNNALGLLNLSTTIKATYKKPKKRLSRTAEADPIQSKCRFARILAHYTGCFIGQKVPTLESVCHLIFWVTPQKQTESINYCSDANYLKVTASTC